VTYELKAIGYVLSTKNLVG